MEGDLEVEQLWPSDIMTWPYVPRRWGAGVLHVGAREAATEPRPALHAFQDWAGLTLSDTASGTQPELQPEPAVPARRNPARAAALAARARLEELGEPVRAGAAVLAALPSEAAAAQRARGTRWGRCVACGMPLRPTLRVDGHPMLLCGKYRAGHTRRLLLQGTAEFDRLPPTLARRAVVST